MFNNYYSVTIPAENKLKNLVARAKNHKINFIDGINELSSIGKIKKFNFNCHYVVLLPASSLFYHSVALEEKNPYKISEDNILNKFAEVKENFDDEFYYDYLEVVGESKEREIKFFAAKKDLLDPITADMEKYKNNYIVSALPVAVFSVINKIVKAKNYLLYYKINKSYTIITSLNKKIDLLQSSVKENELKEVIEENKKYYLNNKEIELKVLEGESDLLKLGDYMDLKEDDFVFLTSLLWSINRCQ